MRTLGALLFTTALCAGCADFVTYNKERTAADGSQVIFSDAKQRAFFSAPVHTTKTIISADRKTTTVQERFRQFCAEPSPDALSALASNLGVNLSLQGKGDLGVNQSFSESAANIGIRTRAIQALRDTTYRNCEGYLNGGITPFGVETLQRRFQSTLVALLAIEQLTGSMPAQSVALTGTVTGVDAASLAKIVDQVNDAKTALDTAKGDQDKAEKKLATATAALAALKTDAAKIAELKKKKPSDLTEDEKKILEAADDLKAATADQKLKAKTAEDRQTDYDATIKIRTVAATSAASVVTAAQFSPSDTSKPIDKDTVGTIAAAVTHIVDSTLSLGFGREVCATLFGQLVAEGQANAVVGEYSLQGTCINYLSRNAAMIDSRINQINSQSESLKTWMLAIQQGLIDKTISGADAVALIPVLIKTLGVANNDDPNSNPAFTTELSPELFGARIKFPPPTEKKNNKK